MKKKLIKWLESILGNYYAKFNSAEYASRISTVRDAIFETVPTVFEEFRDKAIIEGGIYNYFYMADGTFPKYTFVIPELSLYIYVGDITSAPWAEAKQRGVGREAWEKGQETLATYIKGTSNLATLGNAAKPRLLLVKWDDAINHLTLLDRIEKLLAV